MQAVPKNASFTIENFVGLFSSVAEPESQEAASFWRSRSRDAMQLRLPT
jgi:hypothetical protein